MAILLIATRTSLEAFGDPVFHHSDPRVLSFIEATTGSTVEDLALRLEAYTIAGVEGMQTSPSHDLFLANLHISGVVGNQLERTLKLKATLASLILSKLRTLCQCNLY